MRVTSVLSTDSVTVSTEINETGTERNTMDTNNTATFPEGNIMVSAGRLPGNVREYVVPVDSTVDDVLNVVDPTLVNLVSSGVMFIRKNGVEAELYDDVNSGDVIQVAKNVQGNVAD